MYQANLIVDFLTLMSELATYMYMGPDWGQFSWNNKG